MGPSATIYNELVATYTNYERIIYIIPSCGTMGGGKRGFITLRFWVV